MKEETREIINDIKDALRTTMNSVRYRRAVDFLDSLPEIESKLCHGGYIQDKNGTPCCHGDIVKFEFEDKAYEENWKRKYQKVVKGRLDFSTETKNFVILFGKDVNGYDWIDWTSSDYGCKWFEKIGEAK